MPATLPPLPNNFTHRLTTIFRSIFLVIYFGLMTLSAGSQEINVPHRHYTPHDGLPGVVNQQAREDSRGYVWIASNEGIARFNGCEFKMIENHPGFSTEFIHYIEEDRDGRMMFLSETNLTIYNGREFITIPLPMRSSRGTILLPDEEKSPIIAIGSGTHLQIFELNQDSLSEVKPNKVNRGDRIKLREGERMISVQEDRYYFLTSDNTVKYQLIGRFEVLQTNLPELPFFPEMGFLIYRYMDSPNNYFTYNRYSREFIDIPSIEGFMKNTGIDTLYIGIHPGNRENTYTFPSMKPIFLPRILTISLFGAHSRIAVGNCGR
ncbi:MAG: hypothetical protein EA411_09310 [Saprospirales bacterium]|nr:MAG: hypothetical protein EA411_09310 [Saprospirales bacterium]